MAVVEAQKLVPQSGFYGGDALGGPRQEGAIFSIKRSTCWSPPGLETACEMHNSRIPPAIKSGLLVGPSRHTGQEIPSALQRQPVVPKDGVECLLMQKVRSSAHTMQVAVGAPSYFSLPPCGQVN